MLRLRGKGIAVREVTTLWEAGGDEKGPAQRDGAFAPYKRFAQQNLGTGAIHLPRASPITEGWSDRRARNQAKRSRLSS